MAKKDETKAPETAETKAPEVTEEDLAKAAAQAALESAKEATVSAPAEAPAPTISVGDVEVIALRDGAASMGGRNYSWKKDQLVEMHASHALELEQAGWVRRI